MPFKNPKEQKKFMDKYYVDRIKGDKEVWSIRRDKQLRYLGWTLQTFSEAMEKQNNLCAICEKPMIRPCADHEHSDPPKSRGVLCVGCNTALGSFLDSPELCRAAAEYLESWHNK